MTGAFAPVLGFFPGHQPVSEDPFRAKAAYVSFFLSKPFVIAGVSRLYSGRRCMVTLPLSQTP